VASDLDFLGGTLGVALRQVVIGILKPARFGVQIHFGLLPAQYLLGIAVSEAVVGFGAVSRAIQGDLVGAESLIAPRQADMAFQHRLGGGRLDPFGLSLNRQFIRRRQIGRDRHEVPRQFIGFALHPGRRRAIGLGLKDSQRQ